MNIKLNQKIIQDRCGIVSFKRGDAFYRNNKVTVENYNSKRCEATVSSREVFKVTIEQDSNHGFLASCSCPKLSSYEMDCQHIAAVLIAIYDHQREDYLKRDQQGEHVNNVDKDMKLADGLLALIHNQPVRKSGHQRHFENREEIEVTFLCIVLTDENTNQHIGIEIIINSTTIVDIHNFLFQVKKGKASTISSSFTYDPSLHCFSNQNDAVINQLIQFIDDEKMYDNQTEYLRNRQMLVIPPSSWRTLSSLLMKAPSVKLSYNDETVESLSIVESRLPLQFEFADTDKGYELKIIGLNKLFVLKDYQLALHDGKLFSLEMEKTDQLLKLKQMLDTSKTNQIFISEEYILSFLEEGLSGLKKLGNVHLTKRLAAKYSKTPLIAKLYLDRLKNRLLAGLEFHYKNVVINPSEEQNGRESTMVIRDVEREETILRLMDESAFTKTDEGYFFHNEDLEYEFLYHVIPKLQNFVQIYATTAVRNRIARVSTGPKIRVKHKKDRTNWLEFKFEMDGIPEKEIPELLAALEEKRKYYRLRNGSLLSLESREFEEIQRFLHAAPEQELDLERALNLPIVSGIKLLDSVGNNNIFKIEASFRRFLDNLQNLDKATQEVPKSLESILRKYQIQGYRWMKTLAEYGFGGILADDMGLGKTIQSIAFILSVLSELRKRDQKVLIISPSSVTYNWLNELMKFAPEIEALVIDGNKTERSKLLNNVQGIDVLITSYPLIRIDIDWYKQQAFHTVIFDEAQAFKNPITQTARAVKKLDADHLFALTGTPIENSLEELWSIYHVVFPELFGGLKDFSNLTRKQVSRRIRPFLLRRMKEDVIKELPQKLEQVESVELLTEQKKLYVAYLAKLRHDTFKHLDKGTFRKNKIRILAGLTRLRQICCHPALFVEGYKGSSAKFEQLMQIIEESRLSGRRVLIFSQFTKMLDLISRALVDLELPFFYLDGQTPSKERIELCNKFNDGERDLFLISLKAGGTGLNLTGADTVILYDLWWNPAVEEQAADRAHRMGQKRVVKVIKLVTRGTIEEKMNELQEKKKKMIDEIIDSEENEEFGITEDDIREILKI
ncbi:DEAD/DEAH box helicase [Oceanobacillus chungangensis]|uniref:Helicase SNF n=1 Tax=Oceanobacillus chungangensis TaxID=1229152 RepID=A0A3D8PIH9_9BACI|nr:DEAD/DEAH box helicase [Oceanobacillus chungangensis]RDW15903.1 helicase SNF [Oceanobacillus chungangensis]